MYQALYRTWRPKTFSDVIGQEHITENLRRQVKENLEEANSLKLELSEAKREIFKLGTKK